MGKKKKKHIDEGYETFDKKICLDIANHLEAYTDALEDLCIVDGKPTKDVKDGIKRMRKNIKQLRNGEPWKVLDEDAYNEMMEGQVGTG